MNLTNRLRIGDCAEYSKPITEADIITFAEVTGDNNPVHLDEHYASATIFKGRIAHGMLVASMISAVIGTILPGNGTIYLSQLLEFIKPVRIGDTIKAEVSVVDILPKGRVKLKTVCYNQFSEIVVDGEAFVMVPS